MVMARLRSGNVRWCLLLVGLVLGIGGRAYARATAPPHAVLSAPAGPSATAARGATTAAVPPVASDANEDGDLQALLVAGAVPPQLVLQGTASLANDAVAAYFADPGAALQSLNQAGRLGGAWADYRLRPVAPAAMAEVAITFTVATYRTPTAAAAVLADPALTGAVAWVGGGAAEEMSAAPGSEDTPLRLFRIGPAGASERPTYLVQFRREQVVGSVIVTALSGDDDGRQLAVSLARHQVDLLRPAAAVASATTVALQETPRAP